MSKEIHFVVRYDTETDTFDVDYDTQDVKFNGEPIWDTEDRLWEPLGEEIDDDNSDYNRAADALFAAIAELKARNNV